MSNTILWPRFLVRAENEGFRTFEEKQFEGIGQQRSSIIAADPRRYLLLYASSMWDNHNEIAGTAVATGFMNVGSESVRRRLLKGCPLQKGEPPCVCFEYYLPSSCDFSWLRDPERLAAFCKWRPLDDAATVSEPSRDSAAEWQAFRSRAPLWVKSFIG